MFRGYILDEGTKLYVHGDGVTLSSDETEAATFEAPERAIRAARAAWPGDFDHSISPPAPKHPGGHYVSAHAEEAR